MATYAILQQDVLKTFLSWNPVTKGGKDNVSEETEGNRFVYEEFI